MSKRNYRYIEPDNLHKIHQCFVFDVHKAALDTLLAMDDIIRRFGSVSIGDVYELLDIKGSNQYSDLYKWTNLDNVSITEIYDGKYMLELPAPNLILDEGSDGPNLETDNVDHPNHYQSETGLEVIDVIEAFTFDLEGVESFDTGNALKYLCRWKKKNGVEDLKKAQWYINHLIKHVENLEKENSND